MSDTEMSSPPVTMERTVAEIIGWEYVDNPRYDGHWKEPAQQVRTPDGQYWNTTKQPTPDDMLSWLVARDEHDGIETWSDQGGHVVKLWISTQSWADEHHGGSLSEALEQAVRAVAADG